MLILDQNYIRLLFLFLILKTKIYIVLNALSTLLIILIYVRFIYVTKITIKHNFCQKRLFVTFFKISSGSPGLNKLKIGITFFDITM
jgi:hypothetical protein